MGATTTCFPISLGTCCRPDARFVAENRKGRDGAVNRLEGTAAFGSGRNRPDGCRCAEHASITSAQAADRPGSERPAGRSGSGATPQSRCESSAGDRGPPECLEGQAGRLDSTSITPTPTAHSNRESSNRSPRRYRPCERYSARAGSRPRREEADRCSATSCGRLGSLSRSGEFRALSRLGR